MNEHSSISCCRVVFVHTGDSLNKFVLIVLNSHGLYQSYLLLQVAEKTMFLYDYPRLKIKHFFQNVACSNTILLILLLLIIHFEESSQIFSLEANKIIS